MRHTNRGLLGTGQVARELGLPRHRLIALLDSGRVPDASVRVPGRRLFTTSDIEDIRAGLASISAEIKEQK